MSQRTATIESLPMAFEVVKAMRADGLEWGEGYRPLGRQALAEIIQGRMAEAVDDWLDSLDGSAMRDRRNGSYSRHLLTELGDIELSVPRTRRFCPSEVLRSYARRAPEIDRAILAGFVLGLSTRKVGEVLLALLGRKVSASTVSRVAKTLDEAVAAFHARPLADRYRRRRAETPRPGGAGYPGGRQEGDHRLPPRDRRERRRVGALPYRPLPPRAHRQRPGDDLCRRWPGPHRCLADRLSGHPLQRCWAHKVRNVLGKVRKADHGAVKTALHAIMNAPTGPRRSVPHAASPVPGKRPTPRPSPACATTSTTCSPASATPPLPSAGASESGRALARATVGGGLSGPALSVAGGCAVPP